MLTLVAKRWAAGRVKNGSVLLLFLVASGGHANCEIVRIGAAPEADSVHLYYSHVIHPHNDYEAIKALERRLDDIDDGLKEKLIRIIEAKRAMLETIVYPDARGHLYLSIDSDEHDLGCDPFREQLG